LDFLHENSHWARPALRASWWIVAAGIGLRLERYFANRSLWLDEAYLAESILTYSFTQLLTQPLLNWQAAPAGFLVLQKCAVTLLGTSEFALRLVPIIAGTASVPMFAALARRSLNAACSLVALLLFATLEPLVYYASEAKQYGVDVVVALAIILTGLRLIEDPHRAGRWIFFVVACAVGVFLSHPAVFVVAAMCGMLLLNTKSVAALSVSAILACVFVANYVVFLRPLVAHAGLEAYWASAYVPYDRSLPLWFFRTWRDVFGGYGSMWLPLPEAATALSLVGLVYFWQGNRRAFAICVLPTLLAFVASALHRYPFSDRLILFLVPGMILSLGAGLQFVAPRWRWIAIAGVLLVVVPTAGRALFYAALPPGREELRPVLAYVNGQKLPGDSMYVFHMSDVPFRYYRQRLGLSGLNVILGGNFRPSEEAFAKDFEPLKGRGRVWVLITHIGALGGIDETPMIRAALDRMGERMGEHSARGAIVLRYYLPPKREKATTRPTTTPADAPSSRPR
jgi:hypothetical protein